MTILVLLIALARASDPTTDAYRARLVAQQDVESAAAEIARARASGSERTELAQLMATYREKAERLQSIDEPLLAAAADSARTDQIQAEQALFEALARGTTDPHARKVLGAYLGDLDARLKTLVPSLEAARAADDAELRDALLLDIADQAATLALVARYDAADADRIARRDVAEAAGLRLRTGPIDGASLDVTVAAGRLEREAIEAAARRDVASSRALAADALRASALAQEIP